MNKHSNWFNWKSLLTTDFCLVLVAGFFVIFIFSKSRINFLDKCEENSAQQHELDQIRFLEKTFLRYSTKQTIKLKRKKMSGREENFIEIITEDRKSTSPGFGRTGGRSRGGL